MLRSTVKKQESMLANYANRDIIRLGNGSEAKKNEGDDIGGQVSKFGERLNDIVRRYTVMP